MSEYPVFNMEDVRDITCDLDNLVGKRLKEFNIVLSARQEDLIHNSIWKVCEEVSTGNYKHHH